jgi:hypothetical protein
VIGGVSGAAFWEVGTIFAPAAGQSISTTTEIESVAAHGLVGGAKESIEGGDFWKGFIATAATKATSLYPQFGSFAAETARAAVVGGTVAQLSGGKFANGAILGTFSYVFNDAANHSFGPSVETPFGYASELPADFTEGQPMLQTDYDLRAGSSFGYGPSVSLFNNEGIDYNVPTGIPYVGFSYGSGQGTFSLGPSCPMVEQLCEANVGITFSRSGFENINANVRAGAFTGSAQVRPGPGIDNWMKNATQQLYFMSTWQNLVFP